MPWRYSTVEAAISPLLIAFRQEGLADIEPVRRRLLTHCFTARHLASNQTVHIKALHSEIPEIRRNFLREIEILKTFTGQPGFPMLLAGSSSPAATFHACQRITAPDFTQFNDLATLLRNAHTLAIWISSFHGQNYAHRDLSPDHIFVNNPATVTVIDFGMAKSLSGLDPAKAQLCRGYDIQAFGMILWEMIRGEPTFSYRNEALAHELPTAIELIKSVTLPAPLTHLLTGSLCTRSEMTPEGIPGNNPIETAEELVILAKEAKHFFL